MAVIDIRTVDCLSGMAAMEAESVHAVVCDPPYELAFMGRKWDSTGVSFRPETWAAALRVAKPGANLLAFGGTRTWHRIAVAIEDGGWEIRDTLCWLHGQGFPKSLDVSKAIDKAAGAERPRVPGGQGGRNSILGARTPGEAISGEAIRWSGWGTALKPAFEPIVLARKPFQGTVAANVLKHGVGVLNIERCRLGESKRVPCSPAKDRIGQVAKGDEKGRTMETDGYNPNVGRWPANVVMSHTPECVEAGTRTIKGDPREGRQGSRPGSFFVPGADKGTTAPNGPLYGDATEVVWECSPDCPARMLDEQSGDRQSGDRQSGDYGLMGYHGAKSSPMPAITGDCGGASRFFYTAKASRRDRGAENRHPTVKPSDLMRWLVRLVTPPGGTVLDPFLGSGTTALACFLEGFDCIGFEQDEASARTARNRLRDEAPLYHEAAP